MQWWKRPGNDMGRYRRQYLHRCPHLPCRGQAVEPAALPAAVAIGWSLPGTRIGDRQIPLKPKTMARIEAGLRRYTQPMIVPADGTWRDDASPVTRPAPARTARQNDALAVLPFITVHRGAEGDIRTAGITGPLPTVAAGGNHLGVAVPPFLVPLRSGRTRTIGADEPLATVVADGSNHALVAAPQTAIIMGGQSPRSHLAAMSTPATEPIRTLTASGRQFLITWAPPGALADPL